MTKDSDTRTRGAPTRGGRSPVNRSLERGVEILRAFRPGSELLGNGELVERTGLSKATVSRLTQTLVGVGLLQVEPSTRAYRLAPAVLSLGHAMKTGSRVLRLAAAGMRALAETHHVNVGLAAPDRDEMVYLESIRYNRRVALRTVVSGQRVPMELTSLGRAYLATLREADRRPLFAVFRERRGSQWPRIRDEIEHATADHARHGWCAASWQPEVVALASPLVTSEGTYVFNVSVSTDESVKTICSELARPLLALVAQVRHELDMASDRIDA
jgi:DNA-binding IclR family transcriptional regulator